MKWFQFVLRIKFKRENDPRSSDAILSSCEKKPGKKKSSFDGIRAYAPPDIGLRNYQLGHSVQTEIFTLESWSDY